MIDENIEELISLTVGGCASEAQVEQLRLACESDGGVLEAMVAHLRLERLIGFRLNVAETDDVDVLQREVFARIDLAGGDPEKFRDDVLSRIDSESRRETPKPSVWWRQRWVLAAAAMFIGVCAVATMLLVGGANQVVATVKKLESVKWGSAGDALEVGGELGGGRIAFEQGFVELDFTNGVNLIVEGAADLVLVSEEKIVLYQGRLVADVPESAIGFTVVSPDGEIIDLGTKFGVSVPAGGGTEVHVLEGVVKARENREVGYRELRASEAFWLGDTGGGERLRAADLTRFVTELPDKRRENVKYVHWRFDEEGGGTVEDSGNGLAENGVAGWLAADDGGEEPARSEGVFGGGLFFDGQGSYVDTDFGGIGGTRARTVAFWAKLPSDWTTKHGYGIVSWGEWGRGAVWQVSVNPDRQDGPLGCLRLGTFGGHVIGSQSLLDGEWHHVAVVMYGGQEVNTGTHIFLYIDGELETASQKSLLSIRTDIDGSEAMPLRLGRNVGYKKSYGDSPPPQRFFRGWIDEMFVFDEALTEAQVGAVMRENRFEAVAGEK